MENQEIVESYSLSPDKVNGLMGNSNAQARVFESRINKWIEMTKFG